ncbi:MAG: ATP-binding protein [Chloroflexota bacterium]|nr:MAG: ATP-binding protein [Chloroflexota bacterium]
MTTTIAVAGKGGTGKTTVCAMIIRYLTRQGFGPVLAIDADPSSNLNLVLGLPLNEQETVGYIREEMLAQVQADSSAGVMSGGLISGLTKPDYFDYHIRSIMVEGDNVDLVAMGRPEGPGCYCPANNAMRLVLDRLSNQYQFVVMDNEAGLEHLSRRTTRNVEHLLVVTDPGQRGIIAARRVVELVKELKIEVGQTYLIVNRVAGNEVPAPLQPFVASIGAPLLGIIPEDKTLLAFELSGQPLLELSDESPVYQAVAHMMGQVLE